VTVVFAALASLPACPYFGWEPQQQEMFIRLIDEVEGCEAIETAMSTDLFRLTVVLCRFSYLSRPFEIANKFLKMRFMTCFPDDPPELRDELAKYQLEFETRIIIQPAFLELGKLGFTIDALRRSLAQNVTQMTGIML
jgi:hypothetical protein